MTTLFEKKNKINQNQKTENYRGTRWPCFTPARWHRLCLWIHVKLAVWNLTQNPTEACGVICAYQAIRALLFKVLYASEWELYERQMYPICEAELNKLCADHYIYPGLCIWICKIAWRVFKLFCMCVDWSTRLWVPKSYTQIIVHIYKFKCKLVDHAICNPFETYLIHTCW